MPEETAMPEETGTPDKAPCAAAGLAAPRRSIRRGLGRLGLGRLGMGLKNGSAWPDPGERGTAGRRAFGQPAPPRPQPEAAPLAAPPAVLL